MFLAGIIFPRSQDYFCTITCYGYSSSFQLLFATGAHLFNPRPHMGGGGGCHPPRRQSFCSALNIFRARRLIFRIAAPLSFLDVHWKFQVSVIFGFGDMTLFFRSCHDPNGQFSTSCVGYGPCELLTPWFRPFLPVLPPTYHGTCCSTMYRGQGQGQGQPRSSKIIAF